MVAVSMAYSPFLFSFPYGQENLPAFLPAGTIPFIILPHIFNLINVLSFYRSIVWNYALNHILKN